jgi:hypothetical protein
MKNVIAVLVAVLAFAIPGVAQNSHGSISGTVTDPSGAVIPNAQITVTDTDTGAISHVVTTKAGVYSALELSPGHYKVAVDATGFRSYVREGLTVDVQQNATINVKMLVGEASQTVEVSAATSLIDTTDATTGQVLTTQEVQDLPNNGRTPLGFARDEYGAVPKAKHAQSSVDPTAQQTADDISLGGGNSASNEVLVNGIPDFQDSGRNVAFSPALDATDEVRVDVFGANSTYGDTSGGTINITTKSGTNKLHGSASEFYQAQGCSALYGSKFVSRTQNACTPFAALPYSTSAANGSLPPATHYNQFGGTIGGPIFIPKVFDGRNKLFFFYAYEGYVGAKPPTQTTGTVPTAAERNGDFSALLAISPKYQLYNPYTATGTVNSYTETAIPGNILSNAGLSVSPIAKAYYKYLPLPNNPPTTVDGQNNFFAFVPNVVDYRSHEGRIDYNLSSKNRLSGEAHRSKQLTIASNVFSTLLSGTVSDAIASGGFVEDVHTFNATSFLDVRGSISRYDNTNGVNSGGVSPTSFGFPGYLAANSTFLALPQITFSDGSPAPISYSSQPGADENYDTIQLFTTYAKIIGRHQLKIGADIRAYKFSSVTPSTANGSFSFSAGGPTTSGTGGTAATFGSAFALFDLGIPSGGSYAINPAYQFNSFLDGFFLQDDWKLSPTLTVSSGIRIEHETPVVESQNRMVNGFLPNAPNEATTAANAAYAAHPSPLLAASAFNASGASTYANSTTRNAYQPAPAYFSPRIGLVWAPAVFKEKFVVRLGYGIYTNPFNDYNTGQTYGYTGTTTLIPSFKSSLTQIASLADPFPVATNPIQLPVGNTLGPNANLGSKMVYYSPVIKVPYSERSSLDIQYSPSRNILVDIGFLSNHQVHLSYASQVDYAPILPYLSRSPYYNLATTNLLSGSYFTQAGPGTTSIANPFLGAPGVTGTYATASTLAPTAFLMSNPEYSSVTEQLIPGSSSNYNALNIRVAKRESHGLTLNGVFEWSRLLGTFGQLNTADVLNYQETSSDYPFHAVGYGTYKLPFGHGRPFLSKQRYLDPVIGGFQVSAVYTFLSGMAIPWGNAIYTGSGWNDFHNVQHSSLNVTGGHVFNTAVFDRRTAANQAAAAQNNPYLANFNPSIQPNSYNYRTFPAYLLRQDYESNWDANIQKNTSLGEGAVLELRLDCFNMLNRPQYNTPNVSPTSGYNADGSSTGGFGTTTGVYTGTIARQFEIGAHLIF